MFVNDVILHNPFTFIIHPLQKSTSELQKKLNAKTKVKSWYCFQSTYFNVYVDFNLFFFLPVLSRELVTKFNDPPFRNVFQDLLLSPFVLGLVNLRKFEMAL